MNKIWLVEYANFDNTDRSLCGAFDSSAKAVAHAYAAAKEVAADLESMSDGEQKYTVVTEDIDGVITTKIVDSDDEDLEYDFWTVTEVILQ